ncbi:MAG TPA: FtsX-like permease family protein [Candidatus Binatia bacterium]|nr:FtsX-like permease family protein [Candidatus Binatia bacterium]
MNLVSRGIRNAFRNGLRTLSVVVILGLSIGLALTMLVARQAVGQKIKSVEGSIGNTITIAPAGFSSFSSANNSLTTAELAKVQALPHITGVNESLTDRLTTIGSSSPSFGGFSGQSSTSTSNNQTSLTSPVTLNTSGAGSTGGGSHFFISGGGTLPTNFSLPITIIGTNDPTSVNGSTLTITSGSDISGSANNNQAIISSAMASKNSLKVGSTFTAYGTNISVAGIFTDSSNAANGDVIVSLATEQALSDQSGDVTNAIATVDSLSNLSSATTAVKNTLGSSADVTSSVEQANDTVAPLNSVKSIALFSLLGAVIAGAVIILLVMVMIVRERRREIGVVKAIGGSNLGIMGQFMVEAITLTLLGAVIGLIIGIVGGSPVTKLLVNNSTTTNTTSVSTIGGPGGSFTRPAGGGGGFSGFSHRLGNNSVVGGFKNIHATIGWSILLYGLGTALLIAIVGSALASGLIAKVRPAEVMRTE